jgi:hypothetical protein
LRGTASRPINNHMKLRYTYFAIDPSILDSVRAWVLDLNNQAQLVENLEGDAVSYKVCIHDVLEPTCATNKSGEFAALFGLEALV